MGLVGRGHPTTPKPRRITHCKSCAELFPTCRGRRPRRPGRIYIYLSGNRRQLCRIVVIYPEKPVIWDDASIVPYKPFFGLRQKFHVSLRVNHIRPLQRFFDFHHTKTRTASGSSSAVRVLLTPNSSSPSSFPSYAGRPARGGRTACGDRSSA